MLEETSRGYLVQIPIQNSINTISNTKDGSGCSDPCQVLTVSNDGDCTASVKTVHVGQYS